MIATLLDGVAYIIAAASIGSMIFFSAVAAPTVFRKMPAEHAGAFLRAVLTLLLAERLGFAGLCSDDDPTSLISNLCFERGGDAVGTLFPHLPHQRNPR
jgi:hypothetical protein